MDITYVALFYVFMLRKFDLKKTHLIVSLQMALQAIVFIPSLLSRGLTIGFPVSTPLAILSQGKPVSIMVHFKELS